MAAPLDLVIIGGVVADRTPSGLAPGGAAFYATRAALSMGARVGVVTHARMDVDIHAALAGAEVVTLRQSTLTFENTYTAQGRVQRVEGEAPELSLAGVPSTWRRARALLLAPVFHEVAAQTTDIPRDALLGIAPQGWMRTALDNSTVVPAAWGPPQALLDRSACVSLSDDDLGRSPIAEQQLAERCRLLVVTRGARGCTVFRCGLPAEVPGFPASEVDPTGAGDIFAAALLVRLVAGDDAMHAAAFANVVASCSVQAPGVAGLPSPDDVNALLTQQRRGDAHGHR